MESIEGKLSSLSNEEYLSARSKMLLSSGRDPLGARAWLTTAKMMFPNNFEIQYEAYLLEKKESKPDIKKAAKILAYLFENFGVTSNKKIKKEQNFEPLWEEIDEMASLLRTPGQENEFLSRVFDSMPRQCRQNILMECALRQSQIAEDERGHLERIRILMLAFKKFPDLIQSHGEECLKYTIEQCKNQISDKKSGSKEASLKMHDTIKNGGDNHSLLGILINDISPLLLKSQAGHNLDKDVMFDLLSLTIHFVLHRISESQTCVQINNDALKSNNQNEPNGIPWPVILDSFEEIGRRLNWEISNNISRVGDYKHDLEVDDRLWQKILTFHQQTLPQPTNDVHRSGDHQDQIFFTGTLLFLKYLSEYFCSPADSNNVRSSRNLQENIAKEKNRLAYNQETAILVEGFVTHVDDNSRSSMQHPLKRRRTTEEERKYPLITHGGTHSDKVESNANDPKINLSSSLVKSFKTAIKYYELLRSDASLNSRLQLALHPPSNTHNDASLVNHHATMASFYADYQLYQGQYREALQYLRQIPAPVHPQESDIRGMGDKHVNAKMCRLHIRMASVHFCMGEHQFVADQIIQGVSCLQKIYKSELEDNRGDESLSIPESRTERERIEIRLGKPFKQATVRSRHVHFLPISRQSILSYCCRLLIHMLKDRSLKADIGNTTNDFAIGHVIVLLQYCYPEEKDLLHLLLHRIRMKDTFSYPIFCNYVIHIQFLEEFALIVNTSSKTSGAAPMGSALGGTGVTLDICPPDMSKNGDSTVSSRRLGTRGANKGEKVEVKSALKRQVGRSYESLDVLIAEFLTKNRDSIFQCLL